MSSTWLWPAENSRMSCRSARPTASGPPVVSASFFDDPALVARVVELFAEVARVGHAVGEDGDDVSGIELDLGLLVIGLGDDPQGKPGDFLADLVDRAVGAADHDGKVARRSDRQGPFLGVEDGEGQGDELLFDGRRRRAAVQLVGGRGRRVLGEDAIAGVARKLRHHERGRHALAGDVAQRDAPAGFPAAERSRNSRRRPRRPGRNARKTRIRGSPAPTGARIASEPARRVSGRGSPARVRAATRASGRSGSRSRPGWPPRPGRPGLPGRTACGRWYRAE